MQRLWAGRRIAAALGVFVGLAACGPRGGPISGAARGEIVIAQLDSPQTMNPLSFTAGYDRALLFPYLLRVGGDGRLHADLAIAIPSRQNGGISSDGRTITYALRQNAVWDDGAPITANDVVFTYNALRERSNNIVVPAIYKDVQSIAATARYEVRVRLRRPDWSFTALFLTPSTPVIPAHVFPLGPKQVGIPDNPLASHPIGGGPYSLVRWSRDNYLLLRANPRYFGPKPRTKYLRIRFMSDDPTYVGLVDKSLDIATDVPMSEYTRLMRLPNYHTFVSPVAGYSALYFNMRKSMLQDLNVRKAVVLAIDQAFLAKTAAYNIVKPYSGLDGAFSPFTDANIKLPRFNAKQARAVLDRSGWKLGSNGIRAKGGDPLELTLVFINNDESRRAAVLIQSQEQAIGVKILLKSYTATEIVAPSSQSGPLAAGSFDMLFATILGYSALLPRWWFFCSSDYNENPGHYCSPRSETLYRRAMMANNAATAMKSFNELEGVFANDLAVVPLWQRVRIDVCRSAIEGCDSGQVAPTAAAYGLARTESR
jgi:peptide/nickel transport system substrate-binding protein